MLDWIASPEAWIALATLTAVEIVLGIDNIIFITILAGRLPASQQAKARYIGLLGAMGMRILLLLSIAWIMRLTAPLFELRAIEISGRDLILIGGGLFLIGKSTIEIHDKLEGGSTDAKKVARRGFLGVIVQIMLLDIVFSLDSVITAVGLAEDIPVMVLAIVIAVAVMMVASGVVHRFIEQHPTVQMLALSFLLLIGLALIGDGLEFHIPKSSIYFAMAFSTFVELLNLRLRRREPPLQLRSRYVGKSKKAGEPDAPR